MKKTNKTKKIVLFSSMGVLTLSIASLILFNSNKDNTKAETINSTEVSTIIEEIVSVDDNGNVIDVATGKTLTSEEIKTLTDEGIITITEDGTVEVNSEKNSHVVYITTDPIGSVVSTTTENKIDSTSEYSTYNTTESTTEEKTEAKTEKKTTENNTTEVITTTESTTSKPTTEATTEKVTENTTTKPTTEDTTEVTTESTTTKPTTESTTESTTVKPTTESTTEVTTESTTEATTEKPTTHTHTWGEDYVDYDDMKNTKFIDNNNYYTEKHFFTPDLHDLTELYGITTYDEFMELSESELFGYDSYFTQEIWICQEQVTTIYPIKHKCSSCGIVEIIGEKAIKSDPFEGIYGFDWIYR